MKKVFTLSLAAIGLATTFAANAQTANQVELFSFTVEKGAVESNIEFCVGTTDGQVISADWGDGKIVELGKTDTQGSYSEINFTGEIAGTKITIYGSDPTLVDYLDLGWTSKDDKEAIITGANLSKLVNLVYFTASKNQIKNFDASALAKLQTLTLTDNALTSLTLPEAKDALTTLNIGNTVNVTTGEVTAGSNDVINLPYNNYPNLKTLAVDGVEASFGWFGTFEIEKCQKLTTLSVNGCQFADGDFAGVSELKALTTLRAQWNELTEVDLSKMATKATIFLNHNALTKLTVPAGAYRVNIPYNNFTFATLPPATCASNTYTYYPQAPIAMALDSKNYVDLSSQATVGETASVFTFTAEGDNGERKTLTTAAEDYEVKSPGVFQFLTPCKNLQATITNATLPKLTLTSGYATSLGLLPVVTTITLDETTVGMPMTIELGSSNEAGQDVFVDWGNGEPQGPYSVAYLSDPDSYSTSEVSVDKTLGKTIVIKGNPETICTFIGNGNRKFALNGEFTKSAIKTIDLSALVNVSKLSLNVNALSSVDLSKNQALTILNLQSNELKNTSFDLPLLKTLNVANYNSSATKYYGNNEFASMDISKLPSLKSLDASFTGCQFDYTQGANLTTITMRGNGMTSADFSKLASSPYVYLNWNEFETADLSTVPSAASFYFNVNKLTSVKSNKNLKSLNVATNNLTFATLPTTDEAPASYYYSPQADMDVTCTEGKIDLSAQATVGTTATEFTWATADGTSFTDYTVADGVFSFTKAAEGLVCTMKNSALKSLTLKTKPVNVTAASSGVEDIESAENAEVEYFNLQGVKVSGNEPGLYIRRQGNKVNKVIVK